MKDTQDRTAGEKVYQGQEMLNAGLYSRFALEEGILK